ncbi:hypothetical protein [Metamycoplasma equirhinis]|uniref:hypothetical protein n=1 Tax=Metamycoplasma equirhinis TaxID=92402 RepID=UPI003593EFF9
MFKIKRFEELEIDEFDGIICIETNNEDEFIRKIYEWEWKNDEKSIIVNNNDLSIKDIIQISNLTRVCDLFNLTVKNWLYKSILENEKINERAFINNSVLENVAQQMNFSIGLENFLNVNLDFTKLIKDLFDVNELSFIDNEIFFNWLKKSKDLSSNKKTIIIKNIDWIKISELVKYVDFYNFIVLSNNPLFVCDECKQLEICFFQEEYNFKNIIDFEILEDQINFDCKENLFKNYQKKSKKELKKLQIIIKNKIFT